jgi:hypothetical protein
MSANNFVRIISRNGKYEIADVDADGCGAIKIGKADTLEESIRIANKYQDENEVEYGLDIKI